MGPKPRNLLKKFTGAVIAMEAATVLGTYLVWRRLNRDQEFRFTAFQSFPPALELYYQIGETIEPENKIREYDLMIWQRDGRVGAK